MKIWKPFGLFLLAASLPGPMIAAAQSQPERLPLTGRWIYGTAPRGQAGALVRATGRLPNIYYSLTVFCTGIEPNLMGISVSFGVHGVVMLGEPGPGYAPAPPSAAYSRAYDLGARSLRPVNSVVTYVGGRETDRFVIDEGAGDDSSGTSVTRRMLRSLSEADRIVVTGGSEDIAFSAQGSAAAIRSITGDCEISGG